MCTIKAVTIRKLNVFSTVQRLSGQHSTVALQEDGQNQGLRVGLACGHNPNLVEGQFGKMPGTMQEHNMSMQSITELGFATGASWYPTGKG